MRNRFVHVLVTAAIVAILIAGTALAGTRSVGQTFVYDLTTTTKMSAMPAGVPAAYAAVQAAAAKGISNTLTFAVDRVDADGSAHLNASFTGAGIDPRVLAAAKGANTFQAMLGSDGSITATYDPAMRPGYQYSVATAQNANGARFLGQLIDFNRFALGCAKRGHFKTGDRWRIQMGNFGPDYMYDFAVSGVESIAGSEVIAVTMKSNIQGPSSSQKIDASGHYDPVRRLVVDFHEDTVFSTTSPSGQQAGTSSTDFKLRQ